MSFQREAGGANAQSPPPPCFHTPSTDRDTAIGRLHEMAGDPSIPSTCAEQEAARQVVKKIIREDPELRQRVRYYKQFVDAPNGKDVFIDLESIVSLFASLCIDSSRVYVACQYIPPRGHVL